MQSNLLPHNTTVQQLGFDNILFWESKKYGTHCFVGENNKLLLYRTIFKPNYALKLGYKYRICNLPKLVDKKHKPPYAPLKQVGL